MTTPHPTTPHPTIPINLNVDNLIHCIRRDQREAELLAEWRVQAVARQARERGRWSDNRA